jgi:hypothetical protein
MNDEWLRDAYERALPPGDATPSLDDVSAERLRRLVERDGNESERLRTLDVALSSAEGRRELEIVWAAARAARAPRRSWRRYAIAAGLVLMAGGTTTVMMRHRATDDVDVLRGSESPVTLLAPIGAVRGDQASRFAWRPVPRADQYQLVVVDTAGNEVYASETRDTALVLPDSVRLSPGRAYLWWVQARLTDQSTVTAVTQRLVVSAPR